MPRTAIVAADGTYSYDDLDDASRRVAAALLGDNDDLRQTRVAFLVAPSFAYAAVQRGIWRAGGVAVPLAVSHPPAELEYVIKDAAASVVVGRRRVRIRAGAAGQGGARPVRARPPTRSRPHPPQTLPHLASSRRALIIYTSGTTGKPKGAVTTHENVGSQVAALVEAWEWRAVGSPAAGAAAAPRARHHQRARLARWRCGATCEMLPAFDAEHGVGAAVVGRDHRVHGRADDLQPAHRRLGRGAGDCRRARSAGVRRLRLMMSGSAALPVHVLERWREISGHTLLERYGMTEIGMALSNPLHGERRPGCVGQPLPDVDVRLVDEDGIDGARRARPGELEVRGPAVFHEYWQRPDETAAAFRDGWFRTGDMAVLRGRIVPAARPHQRGHHQDRRLQGVGARDRGGAAHAPGGRRVRRGRRRRRGVGRAGVGGRRAAAGRLAVARRSAALGARPSWRPTRCRARWPRSTRCRATRWARW